MCTLSSLNDQETIGLVDSSKRAILLPLFGLSMTLPALTQSANLCVLVAGSKKASALQHVLTGVPDPGSYPAFGLRFTSGG